MEALVELIWPSVCAGCGTTGDGILCRGCSPGAVFRPPIPLIGVRGIFATARYESKVGQAFRKAKYSRQRRLMWALADSFALTLAPILAKGQFDAIVPAPAPLARRFERGFAAPSILARALSETMTLPLKHVLMAKAGPRQATLDGRARRRALKGRIRCETDLSGRILLVDDILTTGATMEACARELLGSGVREVWVAVLCATATPSAKNF